MTLNWLEMVRERLGSSLFFRLMGAGNESEEAGSEREERTQYMQPLESKGDLSFKELTSHHCPIFRKDGK